MDPYAPDVIHFSWNRKIYPLLNYNNKELITTILIHIKFFFSPETQQYDNFAILLVVK